MPQRAIDYKTVHDEIFSKPANEILKLEYNINSLKVLVDQIGKTYTVGPYKLNISVGNDSPAGKLFQNELKGINEGYTKDNAFATFNGISGMHGSDVKMIDQNGKEISTFPDFGQEFYIKFNPDNNGEILTTGKPKFNFSFLTDVSGTITRYVPTGIDIESPFKDSDFTGGNIAWGNPPSVGDDFSGSLIQTGTVRVEKTIQNPEGGEIGKLNETKSVQRQVYYEEGNITGYGSTSILGSASSQSVVHVDDPNSGWTTDCQESGSISEVTPTKIEIPIEPVEESGHELIGFEQRDVDGNPIDVPSYADGMPINVQIGGKVWLEDPSIKVNEIDGKLSDNEGRFKGIQVKLYEQNGTFIATTLTDSNGVYRFYGVKPGTTDIPLINPLKKYYVVFEYDGQRYQSTYYKQDLSGGYSNAKDVNRAEYNKVFERIYSNKSNYDKNGWHKAYSLETKIENNNQDYVTKSGSEDALTYRDVYDKLLEEAANTVGDAGTPKLTDYNYNWNRAYDYNFILDQKIKPWLKDTYGITNEYESIKTFIFDTLMSATTKQDNSGLYTTPGSLDRYVVESLAKRKGEYDTKSAKTVTVGETYRYVYYQYSDQARNVDYGLCLRPYNDLALQKDVYKTKVIINNKTEEYTYAKKNLDETWDIKVRASDELYNGQKIYRRELRGSEYDYNGKVAYGSDEDNWKNLQVYVTYRIAVKNSGTVNAKVNEIVDYFDADQYSFVRAYIGDSATDENYKDNVDNIAMERQPEGRNNEIEGLSQRNYNYSRLYFTGKDGKALGDDRNLAPSELMFLFVTFKVRNGLFDKVKLDQDIMNGEFKVGKRNIAEINSYSTYYVKGTEIPDKLENNNKRISTKIENDTTVAGLIDTDSTPGSLKNRDLDNDGNIIASTTSKDDRLQDDTDKSPNIRLIINNNKEDIRTLEGYVFEDARNTASGEATIGDGIDDNETRINGVTLQLVELVTKVNEDGTGTGEYIGEKVWGSYTFDDSMNPSVDYERYSSGAGKSRVIMTGPGILAVEPDTFEGNNGAYSFKSVPPGDFYVRFIYGDTYDTVLSSQENDVTKLIGEYGKNEKSYNGQDYKSTIYQKDVDQNTNYNGIDGYQRIDEQNFYTINDLHVDNSDADVIYNEPKANDNKNKMYYYDINNSAEYSNVSDAKDIWDYRQKVNNWSKGADGDKLLNYRAEVLASHEKVATNPADQIDMLTSLMQNTFMVAQTGIINSEVEKAREQTTYERDSLNYVVDHLNLGLVERPKAGLKINKEIDNFSVTLSNGKELFNVSNNQSVANLYFSKHQQHEVGYKDGLINRVVVNSERFEEQSAPELLQVYIDDELMQRSTVNVRYKIAVENIGEVDYTTQEFYYKGTEGDENTKSKTSAKRIIDYVSNSVKYDVSLQEQSIWNIVGNYTDLLGADRDSNYVNNSYEEELKTYDTLLTTDALSEAIVPGKRIGDAKLILSKIITGSDSSDSLVYNNLTEIIAVSNDQGRRCGYSIPGNQEMADQSLGNNASSDVYTKVDWVEPKEIDADSAQRIVIMPPTGEVNYALLAVGSTMAAGLIVGAILLLKKSILS